MRWRKINLCFPCRATCNFKGCYDGVKSVKRQPQEIKMYVHYGYVVSPSPIAFLRRTLRRPRGDSLTLDDTFRHSSPARLFLVSAKRVTCASGTSIFINPRMNVCIFIRRLDQLRAEETVVCKKKEEREKRYTS